MTRLSRAIFIDQTCSLLNERGRTDFSLTDVLESCGAKKGSLYHFFPEGKSELVVAAVRHMSDGATAHFQGCIQVEGSVAEGVFHLLSDIASVIEKPNPPIAIPFSAIAAITGDEDEEVTAACQEALDRLESTLVKGLQVEGWKAKDAKCVAAFTLAAIEGAFLLSRIRQTGQPLRHTAVNLRNFIHAFPRV